LGGAYSAPSDPLAGLRGPTSREGRGEDGEMRGETLDPHNVGDRLTPLLGVDSVCKEDGY